MIEEAKAVAQRLRKRMPQALVSADMDEAADTIDALVQEVERWTSLFSDWPYGPEAVHDALVSQGKDINALRAEVERLKQKQSDAYAYSLRLATFLWKQHYRSDSPNWKPLPDLMGVISQIDNMASALVKQEQAEPDSTCSDTLRLQGKPYPRTCKKCGLGPCIGKRAAAPKQEQSEPYDKTELNAFVAALYDKKMQEGKHGHYETMFHVVHQAIKRVAPHKQEQAEPVAFRTASPEGGWVYTNWPYKDTSEGLYTAPQGQTALLRQAFEALHCAEYDTKIDAAITAIKQHLGEA